MSKNKTGEAQTPMFIVLNGCW